MGVANPYAGIPAPHAATHQLGGADPVALPQYDVTDGRPGIIFPTGPGWSIQRTVVVAGRGYWVRGRPSRNMSIVAAQVAVPTAASADQPWEILLWNSTITTVLARTGQLSGASGNGLNGLSLALNVAGAKKAALVYTLLANTVYYAEFVCNTNPTMAKATYNLANIQYGFWGGTPPHNAHGDMSGRWPEGAPPAAVMLGATENDVPLIYLSEV